MVEAKFECFKSCAKFGARKEIDSELETKARCVAPISHAEYKTKLKCCVREDCLGCAVSAVVVFLNKTNRVDVQNDDVAGGIVRGGVGLEVSWIVAGTHYLDGVCWCGDV